MTYSTCSITVEENEMIIERFLKEHPDFSMTEIEPELGLPGLEGINTVPTSLSTPAPMQRILHSKTTEKIVYSRAKIA